MSSKKKSKKVFQVTVSEIPEWNKQLAFDGLLGACPLFSSVLFSAGRLSSQLILNSPLDLFSPVPPPTTLPSMPVVEIWSPIYGPCDSIKPFVGPLMQKLEYDTSVQWPVVSIHKLEAEAIAEKKKGMAPDTRVARLCLHQDK